MGGRLAYPLHVVYNPRMAVVNKLLLTDLWLTDYRHNLDSGNWEKTGAIYRHKDKWNWAKIGVTHRHKWKTEWHEENGCNMQSQRMNDLKRTESLYFQNWHCQLHLKKTVKTLGLAPNHDQVSIRYTIWLYHLIYFIMMNLYMLAWLL